MKTLMIRMLTMMTWVIGIDEDKHSNKFPSCKKSSGRWLTRSFGLHSTCQPSSKSQIFFLPKEAAIYFAVRMCKILSKTLFKIVHQLFLSVPKQKNSSRLKKKNWRKKSQSQYKSNWKYVCQHFKTGKSSGLHIACQVTLQLCPNLFFFNSKILAMRNYFNAFSL